MDLGLRVALEPVVYDQILFSLYDLGFSKQIPNTKAEAILYITNFHVKLAINNPTFPVDTPFFFIYKTFFDWCLYSSHDRRFNSIEYIIKSFSAWIRTPQQLEKARSAYRATLPEVAPPTKELPKPRFTPEDRDDLLNEPEEEIRRLIDIYEKNKLLAGSFGRKLYATAEYYKENQKTESD